MSIFPTKIDDDTTLPPVNDNITEDGGDAINAARDAIVNIETYLGVGPSGGAAGTVGSVTNRLAVSINPDGTIRASALVGLGLVTLPITNSEIANNAGIPESKLTLDYPTVNLFNYITDLSRSTNTALSWIDLTGVKLEPHLAGVLYRHTLNEIDVSANSSDFLLNRFGLLRNNTNSYTVLKDLNSDFVAHQVSDGTVAGSSATVTTPSGLHFPSAFAHSGTGVYIDTSLFSIIPKTANNLQLLAEYIEQANTLLLGTKTQTLFQNGISRAARATAFGSDSKGQNLVPATSATTFLLSGGANTPVDTPFPPYGDDVILFTPSTGITNFLFQSYLNLVKPGDIATVNYGNLVVPFVIKEVNPTAFTIRIVGKNFLATTGATVDISRTLDNKNKYGVLAPALAPSPNSALQSSLIIGSPRGAQATGIGFNASLFDATHYNLYLQVYPDGNPADGIVPLVVVDVTGNKGTTPGAYNLDVIVQNLNTTFRTAGYNFRFIAFEYQGEFGIMLADPYGGAAFSIVSGILATAGSNIYNASLTNTLYPNNVVDVINNIDPLGLGGSGANLASPPYSGAGFTIAVASLVPTIVIPPLQRNFYYINGGESDRFAIEPFQLLDGNGDSYWPATIVSKSITGTTVQVTYQVNENLSISSLKAGKTLVVQPQTIGAGFTSDFGRFTIQNVVFNSTCTTDGYVYSTNITVYDAVHGIGTSPYLTSNVGLPVNLYFNSDSITFSGENVNDQTNVTPFNRHFEIYIDQDGYTFSHERARFSLSGTANPFFSINGVQFYTGNATGLKNFNIVDVSPKLTGYAFNNGGISLTKINLKITSYNTTTGTYQGYLRRLDPGLVESNLGPTVTGRNGEVTRFYDATFVDYIDLQLNLGTTLTPLADGYGMDIQVYPSLRLNDELMLLATCQYNDSSNQASFLEDKRQFGNISEEQLSDSAISFIDAAARYTQQNGVVRGFDYLGSATLTSTTTLQFRGGIVLVNGSFLAFNPFNLEIPIVQDNNGGSPISNVLFAICANSSGEAVLFPLTDNSGTPGKQLTLLNLVNSLTYAVDSSTFSTVVNDRKDLTILYLATIVATNPTTYTITVQDARKYVADASANTFAVLTAGDSQGNFHSITAANSWATYNSALQNTIVLRGSFSFAVDPGFGSFNYQGDGATIKLGSTTTVSLPSNCSFKNCNFVITAPTGIIIPSTGSNISFSGCNFTYAPTSGFTSGNLINSTHGAIYCSVTAVDNVSIEKCAFTTATSSRPPFISFEYYSVTSIAQSIYIKHNQFYNTSSLDDLQAVIAFTCQVTSAPVAEGMKLIDCVIDENLCNKSQMIAITSVSSSNVVANALTPISTRVSNNTCGTIGILARGDEPRNYNTQTTDFTYDKAYGVSVSNNTCHLIGSLESTGKLVDGASAGSYDFTAGSATIIIDKNRASWIEFVVNNPNVTLQPNQYQGSNLLISGNMLRAYNSSYLTNYGTGAINVGIYLVTGAANNFSTGRATIINNTILSGVNLTSTPSNIGYEYLAGYIEPGAKVACLLSWIETVIDGNIFDGNFSSVPDMIAVVNPTAQCRITNNKFYRNGSTIDTYINLVNFFHGTGTPGIVTNNFFDSSTVDGLSDTLLVNAKTNAIVTQNKNQTVFIAIPMADLALCTTGQVANYVVTGTNVILTYPSITTNVTGSAPTTTGAANPQYANSQIIESGGQVYTVSLEKYIPDGASLVSAAQGYTLSDPSSYLIMGSQVQLAIVQTPTPVVSFSNPAPAGSFTGSILDAAAYWYYSANNSTAIYYQGFLIETSSPSYSPAVNTINRALYSSIKTTSYYNCVTLPSAIQKGLGLMLIVGYDIETTGATTVAPGGQPTLILSPVIIQCIW